MPGFTHKREYRLFTALIKEARLRANLTQEEVASAWGTSQSIVSKIERGERRLDLIQFISYCHILGVSPEQEFRRVLSALQGSRK